jgi:hypothetical protein
MKEGYIKKHRVKKYEKECAKTYGGSRVGASGSGEFGPLDGRADDPNIPWASESKMTDNASISIKKTIFLKTLKEARSIGKRPLLFMRIQDLDLVVMRVEDFEDLEEARILRDEEANQTE